MIDKRTTIGVFRDCMKLIPRMVKEPNKILAARGLVRREFERHRNVIDQDKIRQLKMNAVRGISNYLIYTIQTEIQMKPSKSIYQEDSQQQEAEDFHNTPEAEEARRAINAGRKVEEEKKKEREMKEEEHEQGKRESL